MKKLIILTLIMVFTLSLNSLVLARVTVVNPDFNIKETKAVSLTSVCLEECEDTLEDSFDEADEDYDDCKNEAQEDYEACKCAANNATELTSCANEYSARLSTCDDSQQAYKDSAKIIYDACVDNCSP